MLKTFVVVIGLASAMHLQAQNAVKVESDTILASDGETKINVFLSRPMPDLTCSARKGGGNFSEFKQVQTPTGLANQVTFSSPFPGETDIDILDNKYNKVGFANVTVVAPEVTIMEEQSLNNFNAGAKTMSLLVRVSDHHGRFVKTAKLICKISEIVNKKIVSSTTKASPFVLRDDYYESYITGLKDASYKLEVTDEAHLESFDKADNRDNAHPSAVIEGLNISIE